MHKTLLALIIMVLTSAMALAQDRKISGTLTDKESGEPVIAATVQLLKAKDSTYVAGATTDIDGKFSIKSPADGRYILKLTNVGHKQLTRNVTIAEAKDVALGNIDMSTDAVLLKEVVANGVAKKVVLKEDTFIYNAAAYRTPEGSVVEELVKRLPGAEVSDDGKITINGKEVKKIMVDGREFIANDTKTALKNLPTSIIEKVKAYQEKSDLAKTTGIDDGEEETVLDFGLKPGMNKGTFSNIDLAAGTHSRYAGRAMASYMKEANRFMVFGNANNTNERGFGRGGGRGNNGLNANKMLGANYSYEEKDKLKAGLNVFWRHSDGDVASRTATEDFVSTTSAFSNSMSNNYSRSNSWDIGGRLEWKPDTMTTIMMRLNYTGSSSDSRSSNRSASYNTDPYTVLVDSGLSGSDPLYQMNTLHDILVNSRNNTSMSYGTNKSFNINSTISRKLSASGRNITVQGRYSYNNSDNESVSRQAIHYYTLATGDSTYYRNRYNVTPSSNRSYQVSATYSEPIARATFLQLRYMYRHQKRESDRQTHDFGQVTDFGGVDDQGYGIMPVYRTFGTFLDPYIAAHPLDYYLDKDQSRYSQYDNNIHEIELSFRRTTNNYNLNVGLMLQPQDSKLTYRYLGLDTITRREVTNFTPTFDFRYRFNKQKNLRIRYRGTTDQPSMTDLLPITDDSDPLRISKGNPDLKPSFTNRFNLEYNNYVQNHQRAVMSYINFETTRNSVSQMVTYDETTGGRTTQPMNINGNWNINSGFMFNTSIDTVGIWSLNSMSRVNYNNRVAYLNLNRTADADKNYIRTTALSERLGLSFRRDWFEIELNGDATYSITRNKLQPNVNLNTWDYNYGTDITFNLPWNMSVSTSAHMSSRRGYNDASANTDEFIWNAQVAQTMLKKKNLTLSLQFYDLLQQRSSFSRNISATQRTDSWYNNVNSYAMLHVIYRFNSFGGKEGRRGPGGPDGERGERGERRGRGGFGGPGGGGRPGGFGGGRPF